MVRTKLRACLIATAVTLAGATHLARPAHAAEVQTGCTATQRAYAQGFADGSCGGGGGVVEDCQQTGGGGFYFFWSCEPI